MKRFNSSSFLQRGIKVANQPRLVLIAGCTGTGKSTLGMNIALSEGILKCVSTDTIRQVVRSFDSSDAVHRSSYSGTGDAVAQWLEASRALNPAITSIVNDASNRRNSLVLEGVHIVPSNDILTPWREQWGQALGILLIISNPDAHRDVLYKRGKMSGKGASTQLEAFNRIRTIQENMIERAITSEW
eukprot:CAMPEP_0185034704 /NCGR_PEP_ID=MMETSP1103-20130426/24811_1 /TAXON_ID=36769 /ORGANISM="Paraphysomonas bandaiensis, Strain Caron Lab Isolate" /LENGTH=186 /DNA_ID=CAMNT_0027571463 /DNA_START=72 /DNA_END=629 /DNA_ORIENTATION=-